METHQNPEQEPVLTEEQAREEYRLKKRGCILRLIITWLTLGATIVAIIVYVRTSVERDEDVLRAQLSQWLEYDIPEGFYPYSHNDFLGVELITFYHRDHIREDGRTTSLIALRTENKWKGQDAGVLRDGLLGGLEELLGENEFRTLRRNVETVERDGKPIELHVFTGKNMIDKDFRDATTVFRFFDGPERPWQIQVMGLDETLDAETQKAIAASFRLKKE